MDYVQNDEILLCVDDLNWQVDQHRVWHIQLAEYGQEEFCLPVSFIFFHVLFLYYYVLLLSVMRSESESDTYLGFDVSSYWIFFYIAWSPTMLAHILGHPLNSISPSASAVRGAFSYVQVCHPIWFMMPWREAVPVTFSLCAINRARVEMCIDL